MDLNNSENIVGGISSREVLLKCLQKTFERNKFKEFKMSEGNSWPFKIEVLLEKGVGTSRRVESVFGRQLKDGAHLNPAYSISKEFFIR